MHIKGSADLHVYGCPRLEYCPFLEVERLAALLWLPNLSTQSSEHLFRALSGSYDGTFVSKPERNISAIAAPSSTINVAPWRNTFIATKKAPRIAGLCSLSQPQDKGK